MGMYVRVNGDDRNAWHNFVKVNNEWRNSEVHVKINGEWKLTHDRIINEDDILGFKLIYTPEFVSDTKNITLLDNNNFDLLSKTVLYSFDNNDIEYNTYYASLYMILNDDSIINISSLNDDTNFNNINVTIDGDIMNQSNGKMINGVNTFFDNENFIPYGIGSEVSNIRTLDFENILPINSRAINYEEFSFIGVNKHESNNYASCKLYHSITSINVNNTPKPFSIII